jgi:predicted GIY-YIG superfamily endonuclease
LARSKSRAAHVLIDMTYVYLLRSIATPERRYIGLTTNLRRRLDQHNAGETPSIARHRPWRVVVAVAFVDAQRAAAFERYLKAGSGAAFASRHLW